MRRTAFRPTAARSDAAILAQRVLEALAHPVEVVRQSIAFAQVHSSLSRLDDMLLADIGLTRPELDDARETLKSCGAADALDHLVSLRRQDAWGRASTAR